MPALEPALASVLKPMGSPPAASRFDYSDDDDAAIKQRLADLGYLVSKVRCGLILGRTRTMIQVSTRRPV